MKTSRRNVTNNCSRKAICLGAVFLFLVSPCEATTVVVLRTPTAIVIAADSLETGATPNERALKCKIQANAQYRIYFSLAGRIGFVKTGFDATKFAEVVIEQGASSTADAAMKFSQLALPTFRNMLIFQRTHDAGDFKALMAMAQPLQAIFISMERGFATFSIAALNATIEQQKLIVRSHVWSCPGELCQTNETKIGALGEHGAIDKEIDDPRSIPGFPDLALAARNMVQTEIAARPDIDGPPVSILIVEAARTYWYDDDRGVCH